MGEERSDSIVYYILCFDVLLFFVSKYIIMALGIIIVLLFYLLLRKRKLQFLLNEFIFFIIFILINLIQFIIIQNREAFQEIERLIIYFLVITLLYNIRISYKSFIAIWRVMLVFCFAIQIVQFFELFKINEYLEHIYGESEFFRLAEYSSIKNFRSGSIFIAINPYFKFTAVSLVLFFYDMTRVDGNRFLDYIFIGISFLSTFLCGSRTGFIIFFVICAIFMFSNLDKDLDVRMIFKSIVVITFFIIIYFLLSDSFNFKTARILNFNTEDSLEYKLYIIKRFYIQSTLGEWLLGVGAYDAKTPGSLNMDSDVGFMLSYYGLLGIINYFFMLISFTSFKHVIHKNEKTCFFLILMIVLISGITSGVFFNYRVFSVIMLAIIPFYSTWLDTEQSNVVLYSEGNE